MQREIEIDRERGRGDRIVWKGESVKFIRRPIVPLEGNSCLGEMSVFVFVLGGPLNWASLKSKGPPV